MVVDWTDFDWYEYIKKFGLVPKPKRNMGKDKKRIIDAYCAFDIETSTVWLSSENTDAHSFMYIWQFQIEEYLIKGRTWEEWFDFLAALRRALESFGTLNKTPKTPMMVCWIHNAAFEFSYISGLYPFTDEECFFRDARKPIYFRMFDAFEFRCSYIQTNLSLAALTKQTGVKMKLSGQKFDYNKVRYPWTVLTEYEEE